LRKMCDAKHGPQDWDDQTEWEEFEVENRQLPSCDDWPDG